MHLLVANILWLLSLALSVGSAFFASKVQEWVETFQITKTHQTTGTQTTETLHISETRQITKTRQTTGPVRETFLHRPPTSKDLGYWTAFFDYISTY